MARAPSAGSRIRVWITGDPAQPPSKARHRGRPRGGLRHEWGSPLAMRQWFTKERLESASWSLFGGLIGGGVGLLFSIMWLRGQ